VTRSTLARANEERSWTLFAALAHKLIARARVLYSDEPHALDLPAPVYAVDSTLIDLSLALCPWADWTGTTAAVKLHVALDLRGSLPAFVTLTEAGHGDVRWLDDLPIEPGSFYVMDRGYIDFRRLRRLAEAGAFFVVRDRCDVKYRRVTSQPVPPGSTVRSDQSIRLRGGVARRHWPDLLRRVSLYDPAHARWIAVWTNQWTLSAALLAELYRQRWQVELFFRWIKQTLRLRTFYGTSANAVRVQLWSAIALYLALAITRKSLGLSTNLTTFVQVLSLHALSRLPLTDLFATGDSAQKSTPLGEQLMLNHI
jgi:transposase